MSGSESPQELLSPVGWVESVMSENQGQGNHANYQPQGFSVHAKSPLGAAGVTGIRDKG